MEHLVISVFRMSWVFMIYISWSMFHVLYKWAWFVWLYKNFYYSLVFYRNSVVSERTALMTWYSIKKQKLISSMCCKSQWVFSGTLAVIRPKECCSMQFCLKVNNPYCILFVCCPSLKVKSTITLSVNEKLQQTARGLIKVFPVSQ